jgi:4-amino-4-deoxy-L-arabinose transferase-like glycosyltransferase
MFSHPAKSFSDIWNITASGEVHPPLYYWITHAMLYLDVSVFSLRIVPVIFGVLSIPLVYFLGSELYSDRAGIISAMILTISQSHIFYSQEARSYTMLLFFAILTLYLYLKCFKTNETRYFILLGVVSGVAFWTHFWSVIFIIPVMASVLYKMLTERCNYTNHTLSLFISILIAFPLITVLMDIYKIRTSSEIYWGMKGIDLVAGVFSEFSGNANGVVIAIYIALIVFGLWVLSLKDRNITIFSCIVVCFGFAFSLLMAGKVPMMPRYLIPLYGLFIPFVGIGISKLWETYRGISVVLIGFILIASGGSLIPYYTQYSHENWDLYSDMLEDMTVPGDTVIVIPDYNRNVFDFYYNSTSDRTMEYGIYNNLAELQQRTSNNGKTYYVITNDIYAVDPQAKMLQWLDGNAKFVSNSYGIVTFVKTPV